MDARFADSLPRLAALAAQGLGWRPQDFWSATPPELLLCLADTSGTQAGVLTRADLDRMAAQETQERAENG